MEPADPVDGNDLFRFFSAFSFVFVHSSSHVKGRFFTTSQPALSITSVRRIVGGMPPRMRLAHNYALSARRERWRSSEQKWSRPGRRARDEPRAPNATSRLGAEQAGHGRKRGRCMSAASRKRTSEEMKRT
jgi:hypothetical protein